MKTLLEVAKIHGVTKIAVFIKVKQLGIGRVKNKKIYLSDKEISGLKFRAKNKKRYVRNK